MQIGAMMGRMNMGAWSGEGSQAIAITNPMFGGVSAQSDPALVDFSLFPTASTAVGVATFISVGPLVTGQFVHLFVPENINALEIFNLGVGVDELLAYTKAESAQTGLDAYTLGPIDEASNELGITYRLTFESVP